MRPLRAQPNSSERVVFIGPSALRYRGGIAQFSSLLAETLAKQKKLLFISWYEQFPERLFSRRKESADKNPADQTEYLLGCLSPLSWRRTAKRIQEYAPGKILFTWSHPFHALPYYFLLRTLRNSPEIQRILICHNALPHERFPGAKFLTKRIFANFHRIVTNSDFDTSRVKELSARLPVTTAFLPIVHNTAPYSVRRSNPRRPTILFFGTIRPYKGLGILLEAFPLVKQKIPDAVLRISGESLHEHASGILKLLFKNSDYRKHIEKQAWKDSIIFDNRYVPDAELPKLFQNATVAAFPFREVNQSGSVLTALRYGIPVVASALGGIPHIIRHGENGLLVKPNDPHALAAALIQALKEPLKSAESLELHDSLSWSRFLTLALNEETELSVRSPLLANNQRERFP